MLTIAAFLFWGIVLVGTTWIALVILRVVLKALGR